MQVSVSLSRFCSAGFFYYKSLFDGHPIYLDVQDDLST